MASNDGFSFGDVLELIRVAVPKDNSSNKDGLQEAHLQAKAGFAERGWLEPALHEIDPDGNFLFHNMASNGVLLPESRAGGMAIGTNVHNLQQLPDFDTLSATGSNNSNQFLDRLRTETRIEVDALEQELTLPQNASPESQAGIRQQIAKVQSDARIKFAAYNDYLSKFLLDQDTLNKLGERDGKTYLSTPFNEQDPQAGTSVFDGKTAQQRLADPAVRAQFTWDTVQNDALFQKSLEIRTGITTGHDAQLGDISRQLIDFDPYQSLIRYPKDASGKPQILWTDEIRADVIAKQTYAHALSSKDPVERNKFYSVIESLEFDKLKDFKVFGVGATQSL